MLILSRQEQEDVVLIDKETDKIIGVIVPTSIRGDTVRLGFQMSPSINIVRVEILKGIHQEQYRKLLHERN